MSVYELTQLIADAQRLLYTKAASEREQAAEARRKRSITDRERKERLEAAGEQMFDRLAIGDIVKVDGVRNKRFQHRLVVDIDTRYRRFTGRQCGFNRDGSIVYGTEFPTHMANKIREILEISI